ncbi:4Fe-4S binding protein [Fusibacter ferrireducens]|uniref:4Fe-4S binding protein n=1 Tax=Fusibacter ferrireducens TaxID=2785058 RepID=A0ABR9ZVY3_9FIRM|nr:4Fe-4S binding protein [Fusibacter ferrireducens]MBF4693784.1 4Fe-4S binding protein [Fusibacter ferrireducens]
MCINLKEEKCINCGVCTGLCDYNALKLNEEWILKVSEALCVNCKACVAGCPTRALS